MKTSGTRAVLFGVSSFVFQINANSSYSIDKYENGWQPIKD